MKRNVALNNALRGFREGRGAGTAPLGAKLAQHLERLAHDPLLQVLMDVCKAYESLDRGR